MSRMQMGRPFNNNHSNRFLGVKIVVRERDLDRVDTYEGPSFEMPKNKSNKKGKARQTDVVTSDDDVSQADNMSVVSMSSDRYGSNSQDEGSNHNSNNSDELSAQERIEEKFSQALENATEKSVQTRCNALQAMCEILQHRYMPEYIEDRKVTIQDVAERSLKRGKGAEQGWGATLSSLLILQLGVDDAIAKALCETLLVTCQDNSVGFAARAKCCTALGLLNFLGTDDTGMGDLLQTMQHFEHLFAGSYLKGDSTPSSAGADAALLHSAALNAWSLLLTLLPGGDFSVMMSAKKYSPSMEQLCGMLQSPHLDVRMAAGEAIALVLECGRSHDDTFMDEHVDELVERTKELATDSHKYRAKRDRKTQRATFRDVVRFIEEDESPEISVRFGQEQLVIGSWAVHHQYETLCTVIGPGITVHLAENEFLREVLELGDRLVVEATGGNKPSKLEKHLVNAANFKARTLIRGKNRDKRTAVLN